MTHVHTEGTLRSLSASATAPAQHRPTDQTEEGRSVAKIHSQADLILHPTGIEGIVKIQDHIVGGPGNCDQAEEAGAEEADPSA